MAWQNPKTNWVAGDIPGAGDFNRSEGNSEWLKGQTDELIKRSITRVVIPSNEILLSAPLARSTPPSSTVTTLLKRFRLSYPGVYRLYYEAKASIPYQEENRPRFYAALHYVDGGEKENISGADLQPYGEFYIAKTVDFEARISDLEVRVFGITGSFFYNPGSIRNVYIKGTVVPIQAQLAVLQN